MYPGWVGWCTGWCTGVVHTRGVQGGLCAEASSPLGSPDTPLRRGLLSSLGKRVNLLKKEKRSLCAESSRFSLGREEPLRRVLPVLLREREEPLRRVLPVPLGEREEPLRRVLPVPQGREKESLRRVFPVPQGEERKRRTLRRVPLPKALR